MKHFKTAVCLILISSLLLATACRNNNESGGFITLGRYVEVDITPPIEGRFISLIADDGTIVVYDAGLRTRYTSADSGETWTQSPGPGSNTDRFMSVQSGSLLPDGSLLVYLFDEGVIKIAPDGGTSNFPIASIDSAIADGDGVFVSLIEVLRNDRVLISYSISGFTPMQIGQPVEEEQPEENHNDTNNDDYDEQDTARTSGRMNVSSDVSHRFEQRTALYDLSSGALIADLFIENASAAIASGDNFYLLDTWGASIHSFNIATGAPANQSPISLATNDGMGGSLRMFGAAAGNVLAINNDGNLLAMHNNNLLKLINGDAETLLDGNAFSFGAPNSSVANVMSLADGNVVIDIFDGVQNRLYKYVWDENAMINPERTLHIWSLENNDFVRATITELRRRYPDAYITYEVALAGDTAVSASDAIRTLNTRLLSGRGPDIIILDNIPAENYVNRGMLLNLSGRINTTDIYQNLLAPFTQPGGAIYAIPMQLKIPVLAGSLEALDATQTLDALVDRITSGNRPATNEGMMRLEGIPESERAELYFGNLRELYDMMWLANAAAIINNNRLDSDALAQFLSAMQAISDKYGLADPAQSEFGAMFGMAVVSSGGRGSVITSSLLQYITQSTNMAAFSADNLMILNIISNRAESEIDTFPGLVPGVWQPSTVVGISADTEVPNFATEFVNTMLSIEVQRINYGEGLPITQAGIAAQIQEISDRQVEFGGDPFDIDIVSVIHQLQTPAMIETILTEIIWETVERLCEGRIDLEGAVREIERNIRNYLAERS